MATSSANDLLQPGPFPRVDVLGVGISAISMQDAVDASLRLIESGGKGYICVTGVHGVMEAQQDPALKDVFNSSFLTTPDGMPMVWIGRLRKFTISRVYGPDFMIELCAAGVEKGLRHFLYGGNIGVAEELKAAIEKRVPGVQITGTFTPPFRPLNPREEDELKQAVRQARADVLWVGISTPKQDRFMARYIDQLDLHLMAGVGAAFDIHTGRINDSPQWIKKIGMQWFHRLLQEPRRLWRRYLILNPIFVFKVVLDFMRPHK